MTACSTSRHHFSGRATCDCGYAELVKEPGYTYIRQVDEPYPGYKMVMASRVKAKVVAELSRKSGAR